MTAKTDVVVKLVLVFFISLLSFSIGTFVGKKYSDNQHKLAALEPGHAAEKSRDVASTGDEHGSVGEMKDEDIAKLADEFADDETTTKPVADNAHGEEHGEKADAHAEKAEAHGEKVAAKEQHGEKAVAPAAKDEHAKPAVAKKDEPRKAVTAHGEEPSAVAHNVAAGKAPTSALVKEAKSETRTPSSLPKDVAQYSVGKFTVQIAAFANENEAKQRAEGLKKSGYSAFYVPASVKGKTWYRVSVGLFATEKEAKDYKSEFMDKTKVDSAIVQKIAN